MVIMYILFLMNFVVCKSCLAEYGDRCENCNTQSECVKCKVGFWNVTSFCLHTCVTSTCMCTSYYDCLSCKDGYYGTEINCDRKCSSGCDDQTCNYDGTCLCKPNFTGHICDSCVNGRYGAQCSLKCSRGCAGDICSSSVGSCNCSSNYSGENCEHCIAGRYGNDCLNICSPGCLGSSCSSTDGKCDCKHFYTGAKCDDCVDGRYGDGCLKTSEQNHPDETDNFQTGSLTGGVVGAVVVLMAAVAITVLIKRRLSQKEAQDFEKKQETTAHGGNATQPGSYETLNTGRIEKNDRRDAYTRLFTTGKAGITNGASPNRSTLDLLNVAGRERDKSGPYEILNATILKENERSDTYKKLSTTGRDGSADDDDSENISMDYLTTSPDSHSYANTMIRQKQKRRGNNNTSQIMNSQVKK